MEYETKMDTIELSRAYLGVLLITIWMYPMATAMYGGAQETIDFGFPTTNCTVFPNATEAEVNFTFANNNVVVSPAINFVGDFNITCYDWKTRSTTTSSGGGGGYVKPTNENTKVTTPIYFDTTSEEPEIIETIIYREIIEDHFWWKVGSLLAIIILWIITLYSKTKKPNLEVLGWEQ